MGACPSTWVKKLRRSEKELTVQESKLTTWLHQQLVTFLPGAIFFADRPVSDFEYLAGACQFRVHSKWNKVFFFIFKQCWFESVDNQKKTFTTAFAILSAGHET